MDVVIGQRLRGTHGHPPPPPLACIEYGKQLLLPITFIKIVTPVLLYYLQTGFDENYLQKSTNAHSTNWAIFFFVDIFLREYHSYYFFSS